MSGLQSEIKSEINITLPIFSGAKAEINLSEKTEKKDVEIVLQGGKNCKPTYFLSNNVLQRLFFMNQNFQANQRNIRKLAFMCQFLPDSYTILTAGRRGEGEMVCLVLKQVYRKGKLNPD